MGHSLFIYENVLRWWHTWASTQRESEITMTTKITKSGRPHRLNKYYFKWPVYLHQQSWKQLAPVKYAKSGNLSLPIARHNWFCVELIESPVPNWKFPSPPTSAGRNLPIKIPTIQHRFQLAALGSLRGTKSLKLALRLIVQREKKKLFYLSVAVDYILNLSCNRSES